MSHAQILVVEDESIVARDIEDRLKTMGYTVPAVVASGEEAVDKAEQTRSDLVLMDIMLQGPIDGVTAAERIRDKLRIPVIYLTAYADDETLRRAKVTEPFGYILKPFEERELRTTIEIALYKHKMENKLRESEEWLSTTLRSIGDGVIATDTRGLVSFMNPVAEALTGWAARDALGQSLMDVLDMVDEETRTHLPNPVSKVLEESDRISVETDHTVLISKDGAETPIDHSAAPIKDDRGEVIGIVLVLRDITERRLAEHVLRQHAEYLRKRIKELNCFYTIFRIIKRPDTPLDEMLRRIVDTMSFAWQYPTITCARVVLDGRSYETENFRQTRWRQEAEIRVHQERVGTLEVCYLEERPESYEGPFLKEERSLINAVSVLLGNVIEHEWVKERLLKAERELGQSGEELDRVTQLAAGELDRLLESVEDRLEATISQEAVSPDIRGALASAVADTEYTERLLHDLFVYLRVGVSRRSFGPTDTGSVLAEAQSRLGETIRRRGTPMVAEELPTVMADRELMVKLFENLLDAGIRLGGERPGEVRVGAERREGKWQFAVRCSSATLDPQTAEGLFTIFPGAKRRPEHPELGIGLAVGRKIAMHHGGDLWIESEAGQGATFYFTIPAK